MILTFHCLNKFFWWSQKFSKFSTFRLEFQKFSRSLKQFFLTVGQNNFDNKIPFSVHRKKFSPKYLVMRRKQNENNENYLPDKNSFAALFTFEVETFQRVKLFNLTTKLVVKHLRNWVTKISAISDESLPFPPPLFLTFGRLDLLLVACWPARDSGACCWRGCVIVAAPLPAPALAAELAASLSSTDSNKSVWNCFKLLSSHPVKKHFF